MNDILIKTLQGYVEGESQKEDVWKSPEQIARALQQSIPGTVGELAIKVNLYLALAAVFSLQHEYDMGSVASAVRLLVTLSGYEENPLQGAVMTRDVVRELAVMRAQVLRTVRDCTAARFRPDLEQHALEGCLVCRLRLLSLEDDRQEAMELVRPLPNST